MRNTVLIYEDEPALREHMENVFFTLRNEFQLLGAFSEADDVLDHLISFKPDIIIMDIRMKGEDDGLFALHRIKSTQPDTKVLMLTTFDTDDKVLNAICLGADGYMLKTDFSSYQLPQEAIRKSLRILMEGDAYLTPSVAKQILKLFGHHNMAEMIRNVKSRFTALFTSESDYQPGSSRLTRMQTIVLQALTDGKSTSEIAKELQLSENTINTHIKGIYSLLEVHSRTKAIKKALNAKWVNYSG